MKKPPLKMLMLILFSKMKVLLIKFLLNGKKVREP